MDREPILTTATLINNVVCDLLYQNGFDYAHFPEIVDLAVVGTGLGMPQSNISLVKETGSFWDSTQWELFPRPFLDCQPLAYANAIAAWIRSEKDPEWANELPVEVKRPMRKSLKFLWKTSDSFFNASSATQFMRNQSQQDWLTMAATDSPSKQIVAFRHLEFEENLNPQQESLILEKLQSGNRAILLHAIAATERMKFNNGPVTNELQLLVNHHDDEVRAKALCSLTRSGGLDEATIEVAAKMLDCRTKFVAFAGIYALSSRESVPDHVLAPANRGFIRALQTCDYEFVGLFAAAFNRWLDDPEAYFEQLLSEDSPEYLEIALAALVNIREQLVATD